MRVIRACFDEGIESVLAVSEADRGSLGAQLADRVVVIGPAAAAESYLDVDRVVAAAKVTGCDGAAPRLRLPLRARRALGRVRGGGDRLRRALRRGDAAQRRQGDRARARPRARGADQRGLRRDRERGGGARGRRRDRLPGAAQGRGRRRRARHAPGREPRTSWPAPSPQAHGEAAGRPSATAASSSSATCATPATSRCRCWATARAASIHLGHRDCTLQRRYQKLIEEAPALRACPEALDREIPTPRGA